MNPVFVWWAAMSIVALVNVVLLALTARAVLGRGGEDASYHRRQLLLAAGYALGCASRSVILRADVQRFAMVDSFVGSVFVGRSIATVAELCFAAQWALLLSALAARSGDVPARVVSRVLVPMLAVAEVCSWAAVLTTNYAGNMLEESLWGLSGALVLVALLSLRRTADAPWRRGLLGASVGTLGYVLYMALVDVPMYFGRWRADEQAGRAYHGLREGVADSMRWVVTHRWEDWRPEVLWLSLYFTLGVWISLGLVRLPLPAAREQRCEPS
jgi:hypothetical protein